MALTKCPECNGTVSTKAFVCPHCGYPLQNTAATIKPPRKARKRRPNGSGTVVKLSGKRKKPFQVRINTRMDEFGFPDYDVLGTYPDRVTAETALSDYNKKPYDLNERKKTFSDVYLSWYQWKYKTPYEPKTKKSSSQYCTIAAYKKCESLYNISMWDIKATELQDILDTPEYSHATLEHIMNLYRQMYKYCMQFELVPKDYSQFLSITKEDDDESGVPFSQDELALLWSNKDKPFVDTILILCYSGFRINELAGMPLEDIDLKEKTFTGGLKTRYSQNRTVPIHPAIYTFVNNRYREQFKSLIYHDNQKNISEHKYRKCFSTALTACGIKTEHTPHDCRHTFNVLLDDAGVDRVTRYKLMGHKGKDINENVYTHKNIDQLREAVEKIHVKT